LLFTLNWNAFLWPLLIVFSDDMKTMPVGIAAFTPVVGAHTQLEGFGIAMAGVTLLSLPGLMIFFLLQRFFIEGISQTGLKG
jgi:multiple sugar transport system permease protein